MMSKIKNLGQGNTRRILLIGGPGLVIIIGLILYAFSGRYVETENAYIKAPITAISAEVSGKIVEVAVVENQRVKEGDLLFRISSNSYKIRLAEAEAEILNARNKVAALKAAYRSASKEVAEAKENITFLERQFNRQKALADRGVASEVKMDEARNQLRTGREQINTLMEDMSKTLAELSGNSDIPVDEHPLVVTAITKRDGAQLDIEDTVVNAPTSGIISNIDLNVGEVVVKQSPLFAIVGEDIWIEANLKETQLTKVRVGQNASIEVDTYPGKEWAATVSSISPASGAEFSLLPPQNASGNWVKVVQRIPVRLHLKDNNEYAHMLRAGMTVTVSIDTKD